MANEPESNPFPVDLLSFLTKPTKPDADAISAALAALGALRQSPPIISARYFRGETIRIDGYTFERCRFDGCVLVTQMATFTFKNCVIAPDCELYFIGASLKVARLMMHALRVKARIAMFDGEEALFAPLNEDGTFSLE